jgi:phosphoglycolate phosphatase-like HAD superfamily hydrolase
MTMPSWVLFDLNGTLLDPRPVALALPVADSEAVALVSLHDAVMQGMVDTLAANTGRSSAMFARHSSGSYR